MGLNGTGLLSDTWNNDNNNVSFTQGYRPSEGTLPKPTLEAFYHGYVDELVLATRRIGVCVEGYFQLFGKWSTEDGVRKISCSQFKDALGNLTEM